MPMKAIFGTIINTKTGLKKTIWLCEYSKSQRKKIIRFYRNHESYQIIVEHLI